MPKQKKSRKEPKQLKKMPEQLQKRLDAYLEKRGRGRPTKVERTTVTGRADNYREALGTVWLPLSGHLLGAKNEGEVVAAFEQHGQPYANNFVPRLAAEILAVIRESSFPQRAKAQIRFLADSIAGMPEISARRSRDICMEDRQREAAKSSHKILRKEFYVECSCGYKGPALNDACRKCGAAIDFVPNILLGGVLA
jgi:hypothetical protein